MWVVSPPVQGHRTLKTFSADMGGYPGYKYEMFYALSMKHFFLNFDESRLLLICIPMFSFSSV